MKTHISTLLMTGAVLMMAFGPTQAQEVTFDDKLITSAGLSGYSGSVTTRQPGQNAFLYGIEGDEKSDQPCYMKFHWWRTTGANSHETVRTEFRTSKCSGIDSGDKQAIFSGAAKDRVAVSSLSVCTNKKSNHRLKGVELTGRQLDGSVLRSAGLEKYARTNCASWKAASTCPIGQLAVGVDIHSSDDSITGLRLKCALPVVKEQPVVTSGLTMKPVTKSPGSPTKKAALYFHYFGDSKYESLAQEGQINLSNAMEAYGRNVLLSHSNLPDWMSGHDKAREMADKVLAPTLENLAAELEDLADRGYMIDLYMFSHGWPGKFRASKGHFGDNTTINEEDILNLAKAGSSYTGYSKLPIRAVYQMNCYGRSLNDEWTAIGAKVAVGADFVNFNVNTFNTFAKSWTSGDTFKKAVDSTDKKSAWTVMDTLILLDAKTSAKQWGGCPVLKTVLGSHQCAKDYFDRQWDSEGWNEAGGNGKDYMRYSSKYYRRGDTGLRFASRPSW